MIRNLVWKTVVLAICLCSQVIAQETSVDELAKQLQSSNRDERREAAYALAELGVGAKDAVLVLGKALHDDDTQVWAESTRARFADTARLHRGHDQPCGAAR